VKIKEIAFQKNLPDTSGKARVRLAAGREEDESAVAKGCTRFREHL